MKVINDGYQCASLEELGLGLLGGQLCHDFRTVGGDRGRPADGRADGEAHCIVLVVVARVEVAEEGVTQDVQITCIA